MRRYSLILLFLFPLGCFASFDLNSNCRQAYELILDLRISEGQGFLVKEKKEHPENHIVTLLENYCDFLRLVITEERDQYKLLSGNKEKRLAAIEAGKEDTPWFLYSKAEINLQWAFVEVKFGDYMNAAIDINKAYKQLESNNEKYPGFLPAKKCMGLVHALIGNIPGNYKWAADLAGIKGTVKQGIKELREVLDVSETSKEDSWARTESLFYLSFIQLNLNNDEKGQEEIFAKLTSKQNDRPLLVYAAAGMALHTGKNDKVIEILDAYKPVPGSLPFEYLGFMKGVALMNKLDPSAPACFERYIRTFKGINFIRTAYRNLGWCCLEKKDVEGYKKYMQLVKKYGSNFTDEDKQSLREAEKGDVPNEILLRARLLFDGGYYQKAWNALLEADPAHSFKTLRELIEFEYRLARIQHKLGDIQKAISYYEITIRTGENYPYYFAANSALQLGLIYEEMNDKENAKKWFSKCLSMKDHEYQDSIELKAKAGLSRVQ